MKSIFPFLVFLLLLNTCFGSTTPLSDKLVTQLEDSSTHVCKLFAAEFPRKGKFFFYWGYNFSWYSKSDIHFTGRDYDFTIYDVEGTHDPAKKFTTYFNPKLFTVPQHNWKLGYTLTDHHSISIGNDHMKYIMPKQKVKMSGTISSGENAGRYDQEIVQVGELAGHDHEGTGSQDDGHSHTDEEDTLIASGIVSTLEHCDGLNDMSIEYGYMGNLWVSKNGKHAVAVSATVSIGGLVPDTEASVLGAKDPSHGDEAHTIEGLHPDHNANRKSKGYHLAGFSTSVGLGIQVNFFENIFLLARVKGGYINLIDIVTTHEGGRAQQSFSYLEPVLVIGYSFSFQKD